MFRKLRMVRSAVVVATALIGMGCAGERAGADQGAGVDAGGSGGMVGPTGTGGGSGSGGTIGPAGTGGSGSGDGGSAPDAFACPRLLKNGDPCTAPEATGCPIAGCKECIGDVWEYVSGAIPLCVCQAGLWSCAGQLDPGTTIGDCIHQAPFTCPEVQNLYTDATCTVHPPCGP